MRLLLWCHHQGPPVHRVVTTIGLAFACVFTSNAGHAQTFLRVDPQGQFHWASHPTDSDYTLSALNSVERLTFGVSADTTSSTSESRQRFAQKALKLTPLVELLSERHGVDPALVLALIDVESSFDAQATSPRGARGLMQLMPDTAKEYGMRDPNELYEPGKNLDFGIRHLKDLLQTHHNNLALALASYNAGRNAVARVGMRIPAYRETLIYVPLVLARRDMHRERLDQPY